MMNETQKKIVAVGLFILGIIGIIAIFIARDAANQYDDPAYSWSVFIKVYIASFAIPTLVVVFICLGIYLLKRNK